MADLESAKVALTPQQLFDAQIRASEAVNHPAHYGGGNNPYEAIKVIEAWELGFCLGNTVKYISRAGRKVMRADLFTTPAEHDAAMAKARLEDLQKARWYLDREIQQAQKSVTQG
jgi:hypothetical protein